MVATYTYRKEFRDKADKFIRNVIQHRRLLITTNKSSINEDRARKIMKHLETNLNGVNFINKGMAKFFLLNADDIEYLIKSDDKLKLREFYILKSKSIIYKSL